MTDILTRVFKTFMSQSDLATGQEMVPWPGRSALLLAEHRLGRSVLLLAAVTAASHMDLKVMFFTKTQIQSLPVSLQKRFPSLNPGSLKKIKFSYPRTVEELLQQVASLHESPNLSPTPPSLIIVDRLNSYLCAGGSHSGFHPGEQSCAAHVSALLCDTAAFLTQVLEQRASSLGPCRVLASFQSENDAEGTTRDTSTIDPILDVLDRYFQVRCTMDQDKSYEATAAGLQQVWNIYFSGSLVTNATCSNETDDKAGADRQWKLLVFPDGLMEFRLV